MPSVDDGGRAQWWLVLGGVALLLVPLTVALAALREPRWYPALELAQTELHVRDVGTTHTPLTGLIGRIGGQGQRGSHPGPLSFYALAPAYRLAGSTAWALQVAAVLLHLAAVTATLWIARRRGGTPLLLVTLAVLAALLRFYGAGFLTEPWIPYLPLILWVVFVLSVWSVLDSDLALLPAVVVTGSLCAQTHIAYVGLVGGLGGLAFAGAVVQARRSRREPPKRDPAWRWVCLSVGVGILLWVPPIVDEVMRRPGNLTVLANYFGDPGGEDVVGLRRGGELVLQHLDPWRLFLGRSQSKVVLEAELDLAPTSILLVLWLISIAAAWRAQSASLLRLHGVLCVALGLGVVSASRVKGLPWAWLFPWLWGLTALIVVAIALTALKWREITRDGDGGSSRGLHRAARSRAAGVTFSVVVAMVALGSAAALTRDAATVDIDDVASSRALRDLAPSTVRSIKSRSVPGADPGGRYLVLTTDSIGVIGVAQAWGLVNELDRAGIAVRVGGAERMPAAPYLTEDPAQAAAVLRLVTGPATEEWDRSSGAQRVASHDPRSRAERTLQARLRRELDLELRSVGLDELALVAEDNLLGAIFSSASDPRVPPTAITKLERILELGHPSAVFLHD